MKKISLNSGNTVTIYDSIYDLPEVRYHEHIKYALYDLGIGLTPEQFFAHNKTLDLYLQHGKLDEAVQERRNMDLGYYYAIENINPSSLSFAILVHSVNNVVCTSLSIDALIELTHNLSKMGLKHKHVSETLEEIKKNLRQSLGLVSLINTETVTS